MRNAAPALVVLSWWFAGIAVMLEIIILMIIAGNAYE